MIIFHFDVLQVVVLIFYSATLFKYSTVLTFIIQQFLLVIFPYKPQKASKVTRVCSSCLAISARCAFLKDYIVTQAIHCVNVFGL